MDSHTPKWSSPQTSITRLKNMVFIEVNSSSIQNTFAWYATCFTLLRFSAPKSNQMACFEYHMEKMPLCHTKKLAQTWKRNTTQSSPGPNLSRGNMISKCFRRTNCINEPQVASGWEGLYLQEMPPMRATRLGEWDSPVDCVMPAALAIV